MIPTISVSGLRTYMECPFRFRMQYIDGIWIENNSPALCFGKALHKGFEWHDKGKEFKDGFEQEIRKLVVQDKNGKPKSETDSEKERERYRRMGMAMFIDALGEMPDWITDKIEYKDIAPIKHPLKPRLALPVALKFVMDKTTKDHRIIDYKSSESEWEEDDYLDNLQGNLYALAYLSKFGILPEEVVFVVMKKRINDTKTQILGYRPDEFDLAITFKEVQAQLKMIKYGEFSGHCGWCDYCKKYNKPMKKGARWQTRRK
jgi:hypothetical protein